MLSYRGFATLTESIDTVETWCKSGRGIFMIAGGGHVKNQPSQYGIILNLPIGVDTANDIHQIWFEQAHGRVLHRGGNGSGWGGSWTLFSPGTATAAQVLKGYTFSSAAGSNLTGTYDPGDQYNSGRNQGRTDVTSNPNGYGLYTKSQYDSNYNNGYNKGVSAQKSAIKVKSGSMTPTTKATIKTTTGQSKTCYLVTLNNIGMTPLAMMYMNTSGDRGAKISVNGSGVTIVDANRTVSSSHAWSSSKIEMPTWTNRNETYYYWILGY